MELVAEKANAKIVFLSQYFMPEPGATSELLSGLAVKLAAAGFQVSAIAGQPSYLGSGNIEKVFHQDGVEVVRVWSSQFDRKNPMGRILNSLTLTASVFWRLLRAGRGGVTIAVTNPPLLPWLCMLVNLLTGNRYILFIHDVYPDIAVRLGALRDNSLVVKVWHWLNRISYRRARHIVVLGRDMQSVLRNVVGSSPPITIIPNWADGQTIAPIPRAGHPRIGEIGWSERFVVLYSGNIGRFHEIETILTAARQLDTDDAFGFLFYGHGQQVNQVKRAGAESRHKNIHFDDYQPREMLGQTLTGCDVGLVTLKDGLAGLAVPSKLYGLLAAGKPIVVVGPPDCEAAAVVRDYRCGEVVGPGDSEQLVRVLRDLRGDPGKCADYGRQARRAFEEQFDLPIVAEAWKSLLRLETSGA